MPLQVGRAVSLAAEAGRGADSGLPARRDRYAAVAAATRNWQIASAFFAVSLVLALATLAALALRPAKLHVIEVDRHRNVLYAGDVRSLDRGDPMFVMAQLREWITKARTVTTDRSLQRTFVDEINARTSSAAAQALEQLKAKRNPFVVAQRSRVAVEEVSVLPVPRTDSWVVQWSEAQTSAITGLEEGRSRWRAVVECRWLALAEETLTRNPAGFVVTALEITKLLEGDER